MTGAGRHARAAAYFALLTFLFFAPAWLTGRVYVPSDFLYRTPLWYDPGVKLQNFDMFDGIISFYPDYDYLNKSLHRGEFPFWNPYNLGGRAVAFNGNSGYFYPPRLLLHRLLPTVPASGVLMATHLFLAGFMMYRLGIAVGLSFSGALVSGTAWMLNGSSTTWLSLEMVPIFAALLPLGLLAVLGAPRSWRSTAWVGLIVALTITAGNLQWAYYNLGLLLLAGTYVVFALEPSTRLRGTVRMATGFALGGLLAAPMLVPTLVTMSTSQRPTLSLEFLKTTYREALLTEIPTMLYPDAYGNPADDFALVRVPSGGYFIYPELCNYVGVASVLLFGCCWWRRGLPRVLAATGLGVLVVPATPLYGLLYLLPGLNRINSTRLVYLWIFIVALGSGFGLDGLTPKQRRWLIRLSGAAIALWLAVLAYLRSDTAKSLIINWLAHKHVRLPDPQLYLSKEEYLAAVLRGFEATYGWGPTALAPLLWLALFCLALHFQKATRWAVPALLAADLLCFGVRFNSKMSPQTIYPETATIRVLKQRSKLERVMGLATIKPNTLLPFELYDACGYDSFFPVYTGRYFNYLISGESGLDGPMSAQVFPITNYTSPLVNLLGVRYFIAYPGQQLDGYKKVAESPLPIFENPNRLPRAFIVGEYRTVVDLSQTLRTLASGDFNARKTVLLAQESPLATGSGQGEVDFASYGPHQIRLRLKSTSGPGMLVLTDAYSPGWTAVVDGNPAKIYRADAMFRAVALRGGEKEVIFNYRPPRFTEGLVCFGLGLLVTLALLLVPAARRGQAVARQ